MEHLALEIFDLTGTGSKYAYLPDDTSITITDTSEIFASGDVWSHSFTLNVRANAHIFGTSGDLHGSRLHDQLNRRRARLWVEGLPMYLGYLKLDDEAEVDSKGDVDVSFESGQKTFEEMIEGANANQVPLIGDVKIGVAQWRKRWSRHKLKLTAVAVGKNGRTSGPGIVSDASGNRDLTFTSDGEIEGESTQEYPRMIFPKGKFKDRATGEIVEVDYLNTEYPYMEDEDGTPTHPYCNVALCYQRYGYEKKNENGDIIPDYSSEPEAQRGYEYMPANRVNSAPNFFVLYWIRCLMKHLGIHIEENQMMDVEDLRRLFFVNTNCAYKEPKHIRGNNYDTQYNRYQFLDSEWLMPELYLQPEAYLHLYMKTKPFVDITESGFNCTEFQKISPSSSIPEIERILIRIEEAEEWKSEDIQTYKQNNNYLHDAIATSECFPNVNISDIIKAIENGFGVRFLFNEDYKRVRIVLLRNVFRSEEIQHISCEITSSTKVENNIRGFRMTYGDNKEDTHFYYKGLNDLLPHKKPYFIDNSDKHDYSQWDLNASYANVIQKVSAFDKTCYITPDTGNAYGIKVDKDAKRYEDLHQSLFEFAAFMDAEDGDCTGEEETIETIDMGFTPVIMNDLNMEEERGKDGQAPVKEQRFALFVEETMRPRRPDLGDLEAPKSYNDSDAVYDVNNKLYAYKRGSSLAQPIIFDYSEMMSDGVVKPGEFAITSDMYAAKNQLRLVISLTSLGYIGSAIFSINIEGHINEGYRLYLQDNFEPNDDGISPIETHDWGLTLGIMRGSGSDAYVNYEADIQDGEGNDTWDIVSGSSVTTHPDTCDCYGEEWYYTDSKYADAANAEARFNELFHNSNAPFSLVKTLGVDIFRVSSKDGDTFTAMFATPYNRYNDPQLQRFRTYIAYLNGHTKEEIIALDQAGYNGYRNLLVEVESSQERCDTVRQLIRLALGYDSTIMIDNGVSSRFGRFSLKLRAEKPNPYYDPTSSDPEKQKQYLEITNPNLQGRGICDTLYKEYSYWVRNARIARREMKMSLAQLLAIDKTKKVEIGDIIGFIRKMQYSVDKQKGLGNVTMEIMYI